MNDDAANNDDNDDDNDTEANEEEQEEDDNNDNDSSEEVEEDEEIKRLRKESIAMIRLLKRLRQEEENLKVKTNILAREVLLCGFQVDVLEGPRTKRRKTNLVIAPVTTTTSTNHTKQVPTTTDKE